MYMQQEALSVTLQRCKYSLGAWGLWAKGRPKGSFTPKNSGFLNCAFPNLDTSAAFSFQTCDRFLTLCCYWQFSLCCCSFLIKWRFPSISSWGWISHSGGLSAICEGLVQCRVCASCGLQPPCPLLCRSAGGQGQQPQRRHRQREAEHQASLFSEQLHLLVPGTSYKFWIWKRPSCNGSVLKNEAKNVLSS